MELVENNSFNVILHKIYELGRQTKWQITDPRQLAASFQDLINEYRDQQQQHQQQQQQLQLQQLQQQNENNNNNNSSSIVGTVDINNTM